MINYLETLNIFSICGWIITGCSSFVLLFYLLKTVPIVFQSALDSNKKSNSSSKKNKIFLFFQFLILLFQEIEIVYYTIYGILAILGTVYNPFFFCFHLSEIILRFPELKNVILAFWSPRYSLALTFIFLLILEYIFALLGFYFFPNQYNGRCDSLLFCFIFCFDNTFKV